VPPIGKAIVAHETATLPLRKPQEKAAQRVSAKLAEGGLFASTVKLTA